MYLCQELSGKFLKDIAEYFNLNHIGSVSYNTSTIRRKRHENKKFSKKIDEEHQLPGGIVNMAA